jgi:hypothetical protein
VTRLPIDIQAIVDDVLATTVESHAAAIEPDRNRRLARQVGCTHANWNEYKHWCEDCGVSQEQIVFSRHGCN